MKRSSLKSGSGGKGGRGNKSTNIMRQNMTKQKMKEQELTTLNTTMNPLNKLNKIRHNSLNTTLNPLKLNTKVGIKVQSNDVVSEEILMEDEVSFFFSLYKSVYAYLYTVYFNHFFFSHNLLTLVYKIV